jgi:HAD superfamily hydrolase (TIGR01509 family)
VNLPEWVSAIVFDCDGLLVDTEPSWTVGQAAVFAANGFDFGPREKQLILGQSISDSGEFMAEYFDRPGDGPALVDELLTRVGEELLKGVAPIAGALDLVKAVAGRIPIAVASNSPRRLLDVSLRGSGLDGYFEVTVAGDEVEFGKPHPQLYLEAFARLGAEPTAGVALEDSATGVASAKASGAFVITVPSMPGEPIDGDFVVASLADPVIRSWSERVQPLH